MSRQIAVIGLGLIGGSIAMGLKEFEDFKRVGVDVSQPTLRYALEQGNCGSGLRGPPGGPGPGGSGVPLHASPGHPGVPL